MIRVIIMPQYGATLQNLLDLLGKKDNYIICTHRSPDPDGLGAALGVRFLLDAIGKRSLILFHDSLPERIRFLDEEGQVKSVEKDGLGEAGKLADPVVISVDNSSLERMGDVSSFIKKDLSNLLIIDHHDDQNSPYKNHFQFHEAASTSEIVFELIEHSQLFRTDQLPPGLCRAIYAGIAFDTGNFRFRKTTYRSHEIAAHLLRCGVRPEYISEKLQFNAPVNRLNLRRAFYQSLIIEEEYGFAWAVILSSEIRSLGLSWDDLDGLINELLEPYLIRVAVLITERSPDKTRISLRSKSGVNILPVAEKHGGGGHATACGISFDVPYLKAAEIIVKDLKEYLQPVNADRH